MNSRSSAPKSPPLDPILQTKLVSKFGTRIMKQGFTAVPVAIQRLYRYVPGNVIDGEISYMTPTEYVLMTDLWSYWWSNGTKPWPSIDEVADHLCKSARQVKRYIARLEDKGFLAVEEQYTEQGRQTTNRYDFTPFLQRVMEMLDEIEQVARPLQLVREGDSSDRERVTLPPQTRVTDGTPESEKKKTDTQKIEGEFRSGQAAKLEVGAVTIRNTQTKEPEGKETRPTRIETDERQRRNETGKAQETAAEQTSKKNQISDEETPDELLRRLIRQYSVIFGNEKSTEWNVNRARKLFRLHNVTSADATWDVLSYAISKTKRKPEQETKLRNPDGSANKMAYFFSVLEARLKTYYPISSSPPERQDAPPLQSTESVGQVQPDQLAERNPARRTKETRQAREEYALVVCDQLEKAAIPGATAMFTAAEHRCGCPLYHDDWQCAHCAPDPVWSLDVLALIATILEC